MGISSAGDEGIGHESLSLFFALATLVLEKPKCSRPRLGAPPCLRRRASGLRFLCTFRCFAHSTFGGIARITAGDEGIEPPTEVLETSVLPLN